MGLAAPRKRVKVSHDPNNTKWTRDTRGFGHKIMTAQGWQPGDILGAKNASHAEFHTAANASHIRVIVKQDNLGLGAKIGSGLAEGECTGLDVFQNLLGRLNGKDEGELMKEQKSREELKRAVYTETRWGSFRFVKGGYLVGDKIQEFIDLEEDRTQKLAQRSSTTIHEAPGGKSDTRTKLPASETQSARKNKSKKTKRKQVREHYESSEVLLDAQGAVTDGRKSYQTAPQDISDDVPFTKPKKSKKKRKRSENIMDQPSASVLDVEDVGLKYTNEEKTWKAIAETGQITESVATTNSIPTVHPSSSRPVPDKQLSTPQPIMGGRHAVRSRNIAQKRLAVLDTASLNQIFMIKQ